MLNKLIVRNARRSAGNYMIYLVTMTIISTLMFALHSMIFSADMQALAADIAIFAALTIMGTAFIVIIVIWLVHYMVNFMLERRSKEFGTYLILGIEKKQIRGVFVKENILLGVASMVLGLLPSLVVQKVFTSIFYAILEMDYSISLDINPLGILLTLGVLFAAYLLALVSVGKKLGKMHIRDFISMDKQNERVMNENKTWKRVFVFVSALYIVVFNVLALNSGMDQVSVWFYVIGLIIAIYLFYIGLSSFFVDFIKAKRSVAYKKANMFILRQLASKIKTMRFTIGTMTILFTATLLGLTVVMMLVDYQKNELIKQMPFELAVFSDKPDSAFEEQLSVIRERDVLSDCHIYNIYENGTAAVNEYLYDNVEGTWRNEIFRDGKLGSSTYFAYDTYMALSDYNRLRGMLGYEEIELEGGKYILHGKEKIDRQLLEIRNTVPVTANELTLECQEIRMEPFQQNRMTGADYIIVVSDELISGMNPLYSAMTGDFEGKVTADLQGRLRETLHFFDEESYEELYEIEMGEGSNQVLTGADNVMVAENLRIEGSFVTVSACFMLAYLGIVFICAALTVMTVQQLSDASKYRFRYKILRQLGMSSRETGAVVLKQLLVYYLCPYAVSVMLSAFIGMFISERFVYFTGIRADNFEYYILALLVFTLVYAVYFVVSYVGFRRNVER